MEVTIKCGIINVKCICESEELSSILRRRYASFITSEMAHLQFMISEASVCPKQLNESNEQDYFYFTMFNGSLYVCVSKISLSGTIVIEESFNSVEISDRYDALDVALSLATAQFLPLFGALLMHGSCIIKENEAHCFVGKSGQGKTTIAKVCASDYSVLAEDMFEVIFQNNESYVMPIPFAQKEFWWDNPNTKTKIKKICIVQKGELSLKRLNSETGFQQILPHQLARSSGNDKLIDQCIILSINRLLTRTPIYFFKYEAALFYKKDREYINEVKRLLFMSDFQQETMHVKPDMYVLPRNIGIRKCVHYNRWEIWDSHNSFLYGADQVIGEILQHLSQPKSFQQLRDALPQISVTQMQNYLECLLLSNIIKGVKNVL